MIIDCFERERYATKKSGGSPQSPEYWVQKLLTGVGSDTAAGIDIDHNTMLTFSAVWNAVNIISGAVGFLPLVLYERKADGGRDRAAKHKLYSLLHDRPNPFMDSLVFRETLTAHCLLWGNGYAEIEWDGAGRPVNLWPLSPDKMNVWIKENKPIYTYTTPDGGQHVFTSENVLHVRGLGFDGIKGYSVIEYAAEGMAAGLAAERFGAAFFGNAATPAGALEHPGRLSDPTRKHLRESVEAQHKGLSQAHRMIILEEGMKFSAIGIPARDAQLLETRRYSISDVARWFDIPPHMLKDLTRSTYSNIEHQGIEFVTWTLGKWLKRWELETNWKLLSERERTEYYAEFLVDALLRGDTNSRYGAYQTAINSGWMKPNEVRLRENLNPDPAIEGFRQPVNIVTVGGDVQQNQQSALPAPNEEPMAEQEAAYRHLLRETWRRVITKEVRALRKALKQEKDFTAYVKDFYGKHSVYLKQVMEPVLRACGDTQPHISAQVDGYVKDTSADVQGRFADGNGKAIECVTDFLDEWEKAGPDAMADKTLELIRSAKDAVSFDSFLPVA